MENREENFTYLFYREPAFAQALAKAGKNQETDCEICTIRREDSLQAKSLSRTASGYVFLTEKGSTAALSPDAGAPSCAISSSLAQDLFGSVKVIGKHMLYQGVSCTITQVVPHKLPVLFLQQYASVQEENSQTPGDVLPPETAYETLSIAIVHNMEPLNYHKTDTMFQNSDCRIDVNLLKWIVYLTAVLFFSGMLLFCFHGARKKSPRLSRRTCFFCLLPYLWFLKIELFSDGAEFPLWSLPGAWSDLEGWGTLWNNLVKQLDVIFRFRDYPVLYSYHRGLTGCFFSLILCFFALFLCSRALSCCTDNTRSAGFSGTDKNSARQNLAISPPE